MAEPKFKFDAAVRAIASRFDSHQVQFRPQFPDLINQPDLLISPRAGTLIALYAYSSERSSALRPGLGAVEDAFEIKLNVGESTIAAACVLDGFLPGSKEASPRVYAVIQQLFDSFIESPKSQPERLAIEFVPVLRRVTAKRENEQLWTHERGVVKQELRRFNPRKYASLLDRHRRPGHLERDVGFRLEKLLGDQLIEKYSADVPGSIAASAVGKSIVRFDFALGRVPIEVVRLEGSQSRRRIRTLMAKTRLLRYADPNIVYYPAGMIRPLLVVDGNLAGPPHDPARYVRALVSVGWELVHVDELESIPALLNVNI